MRDIIMQILKAAGANAGRALKYVAPGKGRFGIFVPDRRLQIVERALWSPRWRIDRYLSDEDNFAGASPYDASEFEGNLLLNEGIAEMWDLIIGAAAVAYNNANARLGVGDSNTAAAAAQTGLIAGVNFAHVAMEATYPIRTNQTVDFRSVFDGSTGNFAWQEITTVNAATDAGDNMNRVVSNQGVKANGQSWTLTLGITLS